MNFLRPTVFSNNEILFGEAVYGASVFVTYLNTSDDQVGFNLDHLVFVCVASLIRDSRRFANDFLLVA